MVNALQEVRDNEYVKNVDLFEHDFQRIIVEFDKMGECNAFCVAEKSDQLEQFLKANTCENMECIMDVAVEEAEYQLRRYERNEIEPLRETDYEEKLRILVEKLDIVYQSIRKVYGEVLGEK